jgi:hypothetical protein
MARGNPQEREGSSLRVSAILLPVDAHVSSLAGANGSRPVSQNRHAWGAV